MSFSHSPHYINYIAQSCQYAWQLAALWHLKYKLQLFEILFRAWGPCWVFFSGRTTFNLQHMNSADERWFRSRRAWVWSGRISRLKKKKKKKEGAKWRAAVTQDKLCRFDVRHGDVQWKSSIKLSPPDPPFFFLNQWHKYARRSSLRYSRPFLHRKYAQDLITLTHCQQLKVHIEQDVQKYILEDNHQHPKLVKKKSKEQLITTEKS